MKNKFLILLSTLLLFITACTNQRYDITIDKNGNSFMKIRYTVDMETYDLLNSYNIDLSKTTLSYSETSSNDIERVNPLFQEYAAVFHQKGYSIKNIKDSLILGFEASKSFDNINELNDEIKTLNEEKLIGLKGEFQENHGLLGTDYNFVGTLSFISDVEINDELKNTILKDMYKKENLKAELFLKTDGNLKSMNGDILEQKAHFINTYDAAPTDVLLKTTIPNYIPFYVGGAVVIIVGIVLFIVIKKKKENIELYTEL